MTEGSDHHEAERLSPHKNQDEEKVSEKDTASPPPSDRWQMTLEPALVGAMMAINLGQTSLQNFYLRTACIVDLNFPKNICDSGVGDSFRIAEEASQAVVTSVNVSRSFVGALISTIVLLFLGPWSDCSGRRKPLLILPLLGMSFMTLGVILMVTFPGFSTVQVLYAVQIPISLGGNFGLLLAAAFSYIGDICHSTGRDVTRTMGANRAAIQVAHVLGAVSGPLIYRHFGFYGVFPIVLFLQVASLIYVVIRIKDININKKNEISVLNWRLPLNAVKCLLKPRQGNRRKIVLLMLVVALGDRILLAAEVLLAFMYYRLKFQWDDVLFGSFLAYRNIIGFIGTLLILTILKRRLKLSDEVVGALSCVSYVMGTSVLVAAQSSLVVFIGKIYSVMGALEQACQTVSAPLYSLLYAKTVETAPDAWLAPGITLALLQLLAYVSARRLTQTDTVPTSVDIAIDDINESNEQERQQRKERSDNLSQIT